MAARASTPRQCTLVESEALVRAFSPGSTLEPGLKAFRRRGPKCSLETPPLVPVAITNRDTRAASQRHFPTMIDAGFQHRVEPLVSVGNSTQC
jgi:hypothetical protein